MPPSRPAALRERLVETLRPLLAGARRTALLGFPGYGNVGDRMLWLGALAVLRDLGLGAPVYAASAETWRPEALRRRLGDGVILLAGGGNFGDVWPDVQAFRERVVAEHRDARIVQLPQSVEVSDPAARARLRAALAAHPDLHLLVRDRPSLETARALHAGPVHLAPDLGFAMPDDVLPPRRRPRHPVLWLGRRDRESGHPPPARPPRGVRVADWTEEPRSALRRRHRALARRLRRTPGPEERHLDAYLATLEPLARRRVAQGADLLQRGRVVVTDRLHGHLLALRLGRPHVLLPGGYGKLRAVHEAWTSGDPLVTWADDAEDALARSLALAAATERT